MSIIKFSILTFSLFLSFTCLSQDALKDKKVWTLEECIFHARKNSIAIQRAILNREGAGVNYLQSKASIFPSVNAYASNSYYLGNRRVPGTDIIQSQNAHNVNLGISSDFNLFSGLQTQNTIKQNKANYEASVAQLEQTENNVSLDVALAYLDIIFNKELFQTAQIQLKSSQEQIQRTEKLVRAGALAEASLLDIKAQSATDELSVVNAENALELSKLTLLQLLLIPSDQIFDVSIPDIKEVSEAPLTVTSAELYNTSLSFQPVVRSAEMSIKSARYAELAAKGGAIPSLGFSVSYGSSYYRPAFVDSINFRYNDLTRQLGDNSGVNLGIQLNIPIFNNWQVKSRWQNAKISTKRIELNAVELTNNLRQDVEQAYLNAKLALKRYNSTKKQVENLRESFRITEQKFNVGAVNSLDFALAKNNLNKSESDLVRAKYDYIFRLKIVDFYQNKPLTLDSN